MIQVMTFVNQLYSSLSLPARQSMLMLMLVFERCFQFEYSESYTCNMHGDARIEGYHLTTVCHLKHSWL